MPSEISVKAVLVEWWGHKTEFGENERKGSGRILSSTGDAFEEFFFFFNVSGVQHSDALFKKIYFIYFYFWLCWVFVAVCGLSVVAASRGYAWLRCAGFSRR